MNGDGGMVLVDGATQVGGVRALWWVVRHWPALRRELTGAPGYISHRLWFVAPLTVGLTTWWTDEASVHGFAGLPVHRRFMGWGSQDGHTRGGWLAAYRYVHGGPLWGNGVDPMVRRFGAHVRPARETRRDR